MIETILAIGAIISLLVQLLKKVGFTMTMERPKLITFAISFIFVVVAYLVEHQFTVANLDVMGAMILGLWGTATAFYEIVVKPVIAYFKKK